MGRKRYYCEYCQKHLTYGGPKSRKEHIRGKKHKERMSDYYKQFEWNILQQLIDQVIRDYEANGPNSTTIIPKYTLALYNMERYHRMQLEKMAESCQ